MPVSTPALYVLSNLASQLFLQFRRMYVGGW
jgi:hypothetical protein